MKTGDDLPPDRHPLLGFAIPTENRRAVWLTVYVGLPLLFLVVSVALGLFTEWGAAGACLLLGVAGWSVAVRLLRRDEPWLRLGTRPPRR